MNASLSYLKLKVGVSSSLDAAPLCTQTRHLPGRELGVKTADGESTGPAAFTDVSHTFPSSPLDRDPST